MSNNTEEYENLFLDEFLVYLELVDKLLYQKIINIGRINASLGEICNIDDSDFVLAGFYANTSLLSINASVREKNTLNHTEREMINRHTFLASEFLKKKKLSRSADIVYHHHELPNGKGYYKKQTYPFESNLLHIADMFIGMTTPRSDRLGGCVTAPEAIDKIKKVYEKTELFEKVPLPEIEKILYQYK